ncbi:MAG: MFS transporter, partial [Mycobacterium sp.]
ASVLAQMFPVRVRYTGISLSYQISALTAGVLTPLIVPSLLGVAGGSPVLALGFLALLCALATVCVLATRGRLALDDADSGAVSIGLPKS